ncbi:MBL fold metallo-hydrolase RNA specificity domain-containing protein [Caenimonas aquaedulcis]|uniref:MBL fold metallo-hydrolase n=1 Tax=Caenimonas aquaedulcis TaxID=2793270 RepID=A0A931H7N4_9BURK|nr:MBL fold metallo-hydrolase [Caenimonas aquaedulcis]MBG9390204.1 MBL fold metallo-hydrolase [Caenimonas aquaedulcis]
MKLQFLGATDTVTGSKYLVEHRGRRLLVDCGLFQGYKPLRLRNWEPLPVPPADIDAVILTHAHIDHSGYVPLLVKNGFRGQVHCSPATFDLCKILLPDSGWLQEEEAEFANRYKLSKHAPALPLYTRADAQACLASFRPQPMSRAWDVLPGLGASMERSGHMAGSSFVKLQGGDRSILFSGDIGRPDDPVLKPPVEMRGADYLVVESTYGDREHPKVDHFLHLGEVIRRTAARGGVVVIPAFAVGRAQSLLYCIQQLKARGSIPDVPVFLNSPMAANAMEAYWKHGDELRLTPEQCRAVADTAHIVQTPQESERLNGRKGPMVIIAASGMATGGRVVHHIKAFAPDKRNTLLFAGYQAGGTRGASIVGGAHTVRIHGIDVPIRAEVVQLDDLSAHADAGEILDWLRHFDAAPRKTFITHGEPAAADAMRQRIERSLHWDCHLPYYLESVELD